MDKSTLVARRDFERSKIQTAPQLGECTKPTAFRVNEQENS